MKSKIKSLLLAILRLAQSESGELLSVRRKAHLLHAEVYSKMAAEGAAQQRQPQPHLAPLSATRRPTGRRAFRSTSVTA
jgi:hypothetical protein